MARIYDEKKQAIRVIAHLKDFNGDNDKWKWSFYQIWRYQMTWDFAYSIEVRESRANGVYVDLLIKPSYREALMDTMESLGYKDVKTYNEWVGIVWACEHDGLNDIEELVLEY